MKKQGWIWNRLTWKLWAKLFRLPKMWSRPFKEPRPCQKKKKTGTRAPFRPSKWQTKRKSINHFIEENFPIRVFFRFIFLSEDAFKIFFYCRQRKTLTLLAVNFKYEMIFLKIETFPILHATYPPSLPPQPPQLWDFGLAYTYWIMDKGNWNTPRKKNPVSLNARVFQSPIYSHISTPLPCFNVTMWQSWEPIFNIEMREREVWLSTKKFILLKCVNTLSDCSLLWRPRSCPHYDREIEN